MFNVLARWGARNAFMLSERHQDVYFFIQDDGPTLQTLVRTVIARAGEG